MKAIHYLMTVCCLLLFAGCDQQPKSPSQPQQQQQEQPKESPTP